MNDDFQHALLAGVERVAVWSDLLDAINVFPVADGDTGRNLVISLSPLRRPGSDPVPRLLLSARGNSGNLAAQFFSGLLTADTPHALAAGVELGRERAWQAVRRPVAGTMLSVFDALAEFLVQHGVGEEGAGVSALVERLEAVVRSSHDLLPRLRHAGVVDSGALGMFIFLEGFFRSLYPGGNGLRSITAAFGDRLQVAPTFKEDVHPGYCVDTVVRVDGAVGAGTARLNRIGDEAMVISHGDLFKVHLHTQDRQAARRAVESVGQVIRWAEDDMARQVEGRRQTGRHREIHVMTDAAGSVTREDACQLGMTLLNSYITLGDTSLPETLVSAQSLYQEMKAGRPVSTSQASVLERHQHYQRVLSQYERVLYLCVGSVFTGNYDTAMEWKKDHDPQNRLTVIDSGAASGRLAVLAIAAARRAAAGEDSHDVIRFARTAAAACREYIFLDRLKYLAAGGRMSKATAGVGDMLHLKPVISPMPEGAKRVGSARNREGQLAFATQKLSEAVGKDGAALVLLEFSDNRPWVESVAREAVQAHCPGADIRIQPLSLTTGVHTGPGTWGLAILSETDSS